MQSNNNVKNILLNSINLNNGEKQDYGIKNVMYY